MADTQASAASAAHEAVDRKPSASSAAPHEAGEEAVIEEGAPAKMRDDIVDRLRFLRELSRSKYYCALLEVIPPLVSIYNNGLNLTC